MNVSPVVSGGIDTNQLVISNEPVDSASTVDVNAVILPTGKFTLRANCDVYHSILLCFVLILLVVIEVCFLLVVIKSKVLF